MLFFYLNKQDGITKESSGTRGNDANCQEVLLSAAPVGATVLTARTGGSGGLRTWAGSSIGAGTPAGGSTPGPAILTRAPG
jgi:hypothetical protein